MKKLFVLFLTLGLVLMASAVIAGTAPGTGISLTPHDLSSLGGGVLWGDTAEQAGLDRICIYCHAPHHTIKPADAATVGVNYVPLWNHTLTTTTSWTMYSNGAEEPSDGNHASYAEANAVEPGGISKLCLSCHDATVATNAYGTAQTCPTSTGAADKTFVTTNCNVIGYNGDLTNHHPIGFDYASAQVSDDEIEPITSSLGVYTIGQLLWYNSSVGADSMECSTCHDVHNSKNAGEKFLWVSDAQSGLCLSCHLGKNQ